MSSSSGTFKYVFSNRVGFYIFWLEKSVNWFVLIIDVLRSVSLSSKYWFGSSFSIDVHWNPC
jgi:hypothetical protein